jgi:hypothetical protein
MIDSIVKKAWIKALRSKKFKQGQGALRSHDNEYCCLGVLCTVFQELTGRTEWVTTWNDDYALTDTGEHDGLDFSPSTGVPPMLVCTAVGITPIAIHDLIDMNDEEGKTFAEIADYIEAKL